MAFRLVSSGGDAVDAAAVNLYASGVVNPGVAVDWSITSGNFVAPSAVDTTRTVIFGVVLDYAQGASDTLVRVMPFLADQLWEVDCANAGSTAQIGIRQYLSATRGLIHNQATDTSGLNRIFLPTNITSATTGSGKLVGRFLSFPGF